MAALRDDAGVSTGATAVRDVPHSPVRAAVLWPREHGAWGLLIAPLLLGTIVGLRSALEGESAPRWGAWSALIVAAFSLFLLRTPLEARAGHGAMRIANQAERRAAGTRILLFGLWALVSSASVLALLPVIPVLLAGALAAAAYASGWNTFTSKRQAQTLVALAMAAGAPLACIALAGASTQIALVLLASAAVIATNQVSYVHLQVATLRRGGDGRAARWRSGWGFFLFHTVITIASLLAVRSALLAPIAVVGLAPLLVRGYWHFVRAGDRLSFRRLGFTELLYTAIAVAGVGAGIRV